MKEQARIFAIERHGNQRYGAHPYVVHLDEVAKLAADYGSDAFTVAYLHDVVEDTDTTVEEIESSFGVLIAQCVALLTDEPGSTRKERKAKTYAKMAKASGELELALVVKAADRLANLRACVANGNSDLLRMYREEHAAFRAAVYRPDLCEDLWHEMASIIDV